jgi:hypothetical protein
MNDPKASKKIRLPHTKAAEAKARAGEFRMSHRTGFKYFPY